MNKLTPNEVDRMNWDLYDLEHNKEYPNMLTDLNTLILKRVDLKHPDRNNHESNYIKLNCYYLLGYFGIWHIARAERSFHNTGWQFNIGWYIPLRSIDILFEIENLPNYRYQPLGRLKYIEVEEKE